VLSGDGDEWELERALELVRSRRLRSDANADQGTLHTFSFFPSPHINIILSVHFSPTYALRSSKFLAAIEALISATMEGERGTSSLTHHDHNRRIKTVKHNCLIAPLLLTYTWLASIGIWNLMRARWKTGMPCHANPTYQTQDASPPCGQRTAASRMVMLDLNLAINRTRPMGSGRNKCREGIIRLFCSR
jgi:hypothetical protein